MKRKLYLVVSVAAMLAIAFSTTGCQKLKARDNLNKGVQAFKATNYPEAVEYFKTAVELDPTYVNSRVYLAMAYMSQYIPGASSPENEQMAKNAEENFTKILQMDPGNLIAIESMASLRYNEAQGEIDLQGKFAKLDQAKEWYEKLIKADPQKKEAYYSLGVISWAKWYPELMSTRARLGMKQEDEGPLADKKERERLRNDYGQIVSDGIAALQKAIKIDPEYDDAMAYLNLLIRERADLDESKEEYKKDIETADTWVQRAMAVKKMKAERAEKAASVVTTETGQ